MAIKFCGKKLSLKHILQHIIYTFVNGGGGESPTQGIRRSNIIYKKNRNVKKYGQHRRLRYKSLKKRVFKINLKKSGSSYLDISATKIKTEEFKKNYY